jgi:hypothetical protein
MIFRNCVEDPIGSGTDLVKTMVNFGGRLWRQVIAANHPICGPRPRRAQINDYAADVNPPKRESHAFQNPQIHCEPSGSHRLGPRSSGPNRASCNDIRASRTLRTPPKTFG